MNLLAEEREPRRALLHIHDPRHRFQAGKQRGDAFGRSDGRSDPRSDYREWRLLAGRLRRRRAPAQCLRYPNTSPTRRTTSTTFRASSAPPTEERWPRSCLRECSRSCTRRAPMTLLHRPTFSPTPAILSSPLRSSSNSTRTCRRSALRAGDQVWGGVACSAAAGGGSEATENRRVSRALTRRLRAGPSRPVRCPSPPLPTSSVRWCRACAASAPRASTRASRLGGGH